MRAIGKARLSAVGEVVLACLTLGLALRSFFVQSVQVPTGSMEPTLQGVRVEDLRNSMTPLPSWPAQWAEHLVRGHAYVEVPTRAAGRITRVEGPARRAWSGWFYRCQIAGRVHELHLPYELPPAQIGLVEGDSRTAGQPLVRCRLVAGDRVLLDRLSYNFRRPRRAEVVAFLPDEHLPLDPGRLYLKRLVAFGGETVRIDDAGIVWSDGRVVGGGARPGQCSVRSMNGQALARFGCDAEEMAPAFPDANAVYAVERGDVLVLGDNATASLDSRAWGGLDRRLLWGRAWLVYWPWGGLGVREVR